MFSFYGCFSIFGIGLVWVGGVNMQQLLWLFYDLSNLVPGQFML